MKQIALPLTPGSPGPSRIVVGAANWHAVEMLGGAQPWGTNAAILTGPPRSGKSLLARWFLRNAGKGEIREAIDDAAQMDEAELFHRWNRAWEQQAKLLIIGAEPPWNIALPDLRSRLGAALRLEIGTPDDAMAGELLLSLAEERGLVLPMAAADYLVPRMDRSHVAIERLVAMIDTMSLERKASPTLGLWRDALEAVQGPAAPRLL